MNIMLMAVNAKYIHSNPAVYDLRAYAHQYRQYITLKEYTINQQMQEIIRDVYLTHPDVVCVSCYIWNISFVRDIVRDLKKVLPATAFWAGGPEVSYDAEKFLLSEKAFCGVMTGEGEETFRRLCGHYAEGNPLDEIPGLVYRSGRELINTGAPVPVELDKIPFIYENLDDFQNRIIYYESSRGCPFACSYCLSSIDKRVRFRSLDLVLPELQFFLNHQVPQVKFVDRTFNCNHDRTLTIWRYLLEHDNSVTNFHFEIGADLLNDEELDLLGKMRPGLVQLEIGVQSTNMQTLREIRRTADFEKIRKSVMKVHSFGNIHQHLDLIAGLPYEDYSSFIQSFNDVYSLRPDQLQLGFLKVLKGSYMEEKQPEYHLITGEKEPYEVMSTEWLSFDEVLRLKSVEEMVEVYYNTGQFGTTLALAEGYFNDPFSFYESLGEYYEEKHLSTLSHARIRRYEIFMDFLEERTEADPDAIRDSLVQDLYLREKLKSRPAFALDQKPYEEAIWHYRREKRIAKTAHIERLRDGRYLLFDYDKRDFKSGNAAVYDITAEMENSYENV